MVRTEKCPYCKQEFKILRESEKKILFALKDAPKRFSHLKKETGLSSPTLSMELGILIEEGFIQKSETQYSITELYGQEYLRMMKNALSI